MTSFPLGWLWKRLGVDEDTLKTARTARKTYVRLMSDLDRVGELLAPLGWIAIGAAPHDEYRKAARFAQQGDHEAAETLLVAAWNEDDIRLRWAVNWVTALYRGDPETEAIGHARWEILDEAHRDHEDQRYASAISVVLAQLDGIVYDMTGADARSFFSSGKKASHLEDETTLAGHPRGLRVLGELYNRGSKATSLEGSLRRHSILHGRELRYATVANSTKAFVALLAVIEWAKPIAEVAERKRHQDRERRFAGSNEVDEFGRRLDRRGFDEAQGILNTLAMYEFGHYQRCGRYTADAMQLDPAGDLSQQSDVRIETDGQGTVFRAWLSTPSGVVFGVAGSGGEWPRWEYVGTSPPPPELKAVSWRHQIHDELHVDW